MTNSLPRAGGILDQDPETLDEFLIIAEEQAVVSKEEADSIKEQASPSAKAASRTPAKSFSSGKVGGLDFKRVPSVKGAFNKLPPKPDIFSRYHK